MSWYVFENDDKFVKFVKIKFFFVKTGVEQFNCWKKNQNVLIHYLSRRFWYLTKIDFFSFFPALLLWKEIKQKQIPIVIWKWMSHCSRDSKCIHTQCVHLIIIISNTDQFSYSLKFSCQFFEYFIILKFVSNTRYTLEFKRVCIFSSYSERY